MTSKYDTELYYIYRILLLVEWIMPSAGRGKRNLNQDSHIYLVDNRYWGQYNTMPILRMLLFDIYSTTWVKSMMEMLPSWRKQLPVEQTSVEDARQRGWLPGLLYVFLCFPAEVWPLRDVRRKNHAL